MPYKNIEDRRECRRRWYKNNKDSEKTHISRRKKEIKAWFLNYKKTLQCTNCKENNYICLDFHHLNPKIKTKDISIMVREGYSIKRILNEINKCVVLCANCHRKIHK